MTKTVYAYAAADGKYLGPRTLDDTDRSPISGAWQIPGNMTETKLPATVKEGYDIYWRNGKWTQVEKPKPQEPEPVQPSEPQPQPQPQEPYIDQEKLDLAEAMVGFEARLSAIEELQKGGDKK